MRNPGFSDYSRTQIFAKKRMLQAVAASAISFALIACGGGGSSLPSPNSTYFKTATLQYVVAGNPIQSTSFTRRSAALCAPSNLDLFGVSDVFVGVIGTLNNNQNINWGQEDTSLGSQNWVTSPIAGGFNVSEVQADIPGYVGSNGLPWNIMKSFVLTTNGNTTVSVSVPAASTTTNANISIVDSGVPMNNVPLNTAFTLSHGETITWTGQILTETVTDGASGGMIKTTAQYFPNSLADMNYVNLNVYATNAVLGGSLLTTALGSSGAASSCTPNPAPSGPTPTPIPAPSVPLSTPCALPSASSPNPHPTQDTVGGACTS